MKEFACGKTCRQEATMMNNKGFGVVEVLLVLIIIIGLVVIFAPYIEDMLLAIMNYFS